MTGPALSSVVAAVAIALVDRRPSWYAPLVERREWRETVDQIAYQLSITGESFDRHAFLCACGTARVLTDDRPEIVCAECGSPEIQSTAWIVENTGEVLNDEAPTDEHYCPDCERHVDAEWTDPPGVGTGLLLLNVPLGAQL